MLYNDLRFNNPFEFGWHYMLVRDVNQTIVHQFGFDYFWFNFRLYLSQFFRIEPHFPFIQPISLPAPAGYWTKFGDVGGGILWRYPGMLLVLAVPCLWRGRPVQIFSPLFWFVIGLFLVFVANSFVLCLFCAAGASYEMDFLPVLLLLSVIGFFGLESVMWPFPLRVALLRWMGCLLLLYSLIFNALLNIETHAQIKYLAGNVFLHRGQFDRAMAEYRSAEAFWPNYADAHYGLANTLVKEGHINDAITEYQKTLEIAPDYTLAYGNLGNSLLATGDADDAVTQTSSATSAMRFYRKAIRTRRWFNIKKPWKLNLVRRKNAANSLPVFSTSGRWRTALLSSKKPLNWTPLRQTIMPFLPMRFLKRGFWMRQ
jgi:hypothetical protein